MKPRGPVGGDYYDCIALPTGYWGLAIADVSGKGMQAALLMATLRAGLISELSRRNGTEVPVAEQDDLSAAALYAELTQMALILNSPSFTPAGQKRNTLLFSTVILTQKRISSQRSMLGIIHRFSLEKMAPCKWLGEDVGGIPLGMFPNDMVSSIAEYEAEHVQLVSGDVVVYYTDGVTETENVDDEYYEEDRLVEDSKACKGSDAEGILKYLHDAVMEFQGEADQFDDLTLLILRKQ